MPSLNFQARFAELVESGSKRQTIRPERKYPIKVGDQLFLYTGLRTKACQSLGVVVCTHTDKISLIRSDRPGHIAAIGGSPFTFDETARRDGFESVAEMVRWFEKTHGLPFTGQLIRW